MKQSSAANPLSHGFSLVELMVVIAMVGILVAIAGPNIENIIRSSKLDAATEAFRAGQAYTRSEAIARATRVSMVANAGGWPSGWRIFTDDSTLVANCVLDTSAGESLLRVQEPTATNVSFIPGSSSTTGAGSCTPAASGVPTLGTCLSYDASGIARGTSGGLDPITVCISDISNPSTKYRRMTINSTGQLFLQKVSN